MAVENVLSVFVLGVFIFSFFSFKCFAIFQQCSYKINEFMPILLKSKKGEICRLLTYSLAFYAVLYLCSLFFEVSAEGFSLVFFISSVVFSGLFYLRSKIIKQPKFTNRYLRIYLTSAICYGICCTCLFSVLQNAVTNYLCLFITVYTLLPIAIPFFICLGKIVNYPYDKARYIISLRVCKRRLSKNKDLIKIGITGSFGKTSVKTYLEKMLSTKYKVLSTPKSYNTPLGICKTVKGGVEGYEVFIAEMGARYKNDIKNLCKIVKPSVGVITGIAEQHTQTLGSIEKVKKAKNQLIEALSINDFAVFSIQTPYSKQMYNEAKVKKYAVGNEQGCLVGYKNFDQTKDGINFDMILDAKAYRVFAPLIGEHNALNICLASAVSFRLGVDVQKILSVIPTLEAVEHRAKIIKGQNGIVVIDDGYNANLEGIRSTASAVGSFDGFKIAVSSGIVEVGKNTQRINFEVGKILANHFNLIIAVGVNARYIKDGASASNVEVLCVEHTSDAKNIINQRAKQNDVVAFFNDLPDKY